MREIRAMMIAGAVLALSGAAGAQPPKRVDPGYEDVSPHAISFKRLDIDQRVPIGFDGVYQLSSIDAFGRGQSLFMRIDGAVMAVFPRSVYVPAGAGMVPEIPPGTVFRVGPLPEPPGPGRGPRAETFIDLSVSAEDRPRVPVAPVAGVGSLITDEWYRQRRVEALLNHAAGR